MSILSGVLLGMPLGQKRGVGFSLANSIKLLQSSPSSSHFHLPRLRAQDVPGPRHAQSESSHSTCAGCAVLFCCAFLDCLPVC